MLAHEGVHAHAKQIGNSRKGGYGWIAFTRVFGDLDKSQDNHHGECCGGQKTKVGKKKITDEGNHVKKEIPYLPHRPKKCI